MCKKKVENELGLLINFLISSLGIQIFLNIFSLQSNLLFRKF